MTQFVIPLGTNEGQSNTFFRRLPVCLAPKDRIQLQTLIFACDVLNAVTHRMQAKLAELTSKNKVDLTRHLKVLIISDAWSAVDSIHVIRQTLKSLRPSTLPAESADWLIRSKPATLMRNRMDHLSSLFDNLSKRVGKTMPLFGAITYVQSRPKNGFYEIDYLTITSGWSAEGVTWHTPAFKVNEPPDGPALHFQAFNYEIDLTAIMLDALKIIGAMSHWAEQILQQHISTAPLTISEREEALKPVSDDHVMIASFRVTPSPDGLSYQVESVLR